MEDLLKIPIEQGEVINQDGFSPGVGVGTLGDQGLQLGGFIAAITPVVAINHMGILSYLVGPCHLTGEGLEWWGFRRFLWPKKAGAEWL